MTREIRVDRVKVCGEPNCFPSEHRPAGLETGQIPVWGKSHTGTRCCVNVLPGTYRHCNLRIRYTCAGEFMPHAALQFALGVPGLHLLW